MKINLSFKWYDFWIGAYWRKENKTLYICPLPMVCISIKFGATGSTNNAAPVQPNGRSYPYETMKREAAKLGEEMEPCDNEVFKKGKCVFMAHSVAPAVIEEWVRRLAKMSGQRVDWHYAGGRARVLALGDMAAIRRALTELAPEMEALMHAEFERIW